MLAAAYSPPNVNAAIIDTLTTYARLRSPSGMIAGATRFAIKDPPTAGPCGLNRAITNDPAGPGGHTNGGGLLRPTKENRRGPRRIFRNRDQGHRHHPSSSF